MLSYKVHPEKRHDALKGFSQMTLDDDKADMGKQIKLIGRWHDVTHSKGVPFSNAIIRKLFTIGRSIGTLHLTWKYPRYWMMRKQEH